MGAISSTSHVPAQGGHVEIPWTDVGGPNYLPPTAPSFTPPPFDPSHLQTMFVQVFSNTGVTVPFGFCISNIAVF